MPDFGPSQSEVERAFLDELNRHGYLVNSLEVDTKDFVRFDAPGDKPGRRNGFYKLAMGKWPVGWFGDWKQGGQHEWRYDDGRTLTKREEAEIKAERRRLKLEAERATEMRQREVAEDASRLWGDASTEAHGHPYLERKGISIPRGLRVHMARDGTRLLVVPMWAFDLRGQPQLMNLQMISPDGEKRFLKGGRVSGLFFSLKGDPSMIVVCEGVATGFSIWQATGWSVVCAFNAGNLAEVVKELGIHRSTATLIIAGDDDQVAPADWAERGRGKAWENTGRLKAEAIGRKLDLRVVFPCFEGAPSRDRTDFNDLHLTEGEAVVAAQLRNVMRPARVDGGEPVDVIETAGADWKKALPTTANGIVDGTNVEGVAMFIANHRLLAGRLAFNAFSQVVELDGNEMADHHIAEMRRVMHADGFRAKKADVADEIYSAARKNVYDPLADYLGGLQWDGKLRLDSWLSDYLGAEPSPYSVTVGRKFLIGAVARALDPGCKMDNMLVLEGDQGAGKSTAVRYMFGDRFFTDHLPDFHSKDAFQQLQGAWCVEIAEMSAMTKAEVKDVKAFLSRVVDKFRPPFGRLPVSIPRRVVFVGTVNPEEGGYLRDPTGARRFWPVRTGKIDLGALLTDRDQIWAEAVQAFQQGEKWHLADLEAIDAAQREQEARREVHPWEAIVQSYVAEYGCTELTIHRIASDIVKIPADRQNAQSARTIGAVMRALGWRAEFRRPSPGAKPARVFVSPDVPEMIHAVLVETPMAAPPPSAPMPVSEDDYWGGPDGLSWD